jgi:hypothetical protein
MEFFHNAETDTQGFGAYGKHCIVICFRGTESSRDWSTNIKISEVATPSSLLSFAPADVGRTHAWCVRCVCVCVWCACPQTEPFPDMPAVKVHNGFNRALTSVLEQVVDFIAKGLEFNPSLPLYAARLPPLHPPFVRRC